MRSIIKLVLLLIVGILVYNYFLGSADEKATSEKVFRQVKEVGRSIGDLVKNEKEKFKDGKYDQAFEKLTEAYENLKGKVDGDENRLERETLQDLEQQKKDLEIKKRNLEEELEKSNPDEKAIKDSKDFDEELRRLMDQTSALLEKVMKKNQKEEGQ